MNTTVLAARQRAAEHRRRFEPRFAAYFDSLTDPAGGALEVPPGRFPARALDLVRDMSLRGGKSLRVAFLHEAAALAGDRPVPGLDEAAISIELVQTHGLIHDDIIDGSATTGSTCSVTPPHWASPSAPTSDPAAAVTPSTPCSPPTPSTRASAGPSRAPSETRSATTTPSDASAP
ncbi:polyprenyl synthetase family protein [Streptomyces sp. NPDC090108]|uniref:polyprenyl synthetase family protein n=1 Tax=Streptomyces sp. NPDC090108 TaxID=3365947 RepID=UPI0037FA619F